MDPYRCLRCASLSIGVWNLIYCLTQFIVLGWQVQVVKALQWEFENRQLPATGAIDAFQARFPGLYAIYSETPEKRRINVMFVVLLVCLGLSFVHLMATIAMLYGAAKRLPNWIIPWFLSCPLMIILCTAYAVLWWSGDIFNEQLTMSVAEFVMSLAINGPCFVVVIMYFLRLTGKLSSGKTSRHEFYRRDQRQGYPHPQQNGGICEPKGPLPPWHISSLRQLPPSLERKLRRREREMSLRCQRVAATQDYQNLGRGFDYGRAVPIMPRRSSATDALPLGASAKSFRRHRSEMGESRSQYPPQMAQHWAGPTSSREHLVASQYSPAQNIPPFTLKRESTLSFRQQRPRSGILPKAPSRTANEERRKREERKRIAEFSLFRRKSPQRVSFHSRPKVYQRTPESSLSSVNAHQVMQEVHTIV